MVCRVLIPLVLTGLLALACDMYSANPLPITSDPNLLPADAADTVEGCDEAEQMAVVISGELSAPWTLRERIREDLAEIRYVWKDTVPRVAIEFLQPWAFSAVEVEVTPATAVAIDSGTYDCWDSLCEANALDSVVPRPCGVSRCTMTLFFEECQNSTRLAESYADLPGFLYSEPTDWWEDGPGLFAHQIGDTMVYFFKDGSFEMAPPETFDIFMSCDAAITYRGFYDDYLTIPEPWKTWADSAAAPYREKPYWPVWDRPQGGDWREASSAQSDYKRSLLWY